MFAQSLINSVVSLPGVAEATLAMPSVGSALCWMLVVALVGSGLGILLERDTAGASRAQTVARPELDFEVDCDYRQAA